MIITKEQVQDLQTADAVQLRYEDDEKPQQAIPRLTCYRSPATRPEELRAYSTFSAGWQAYASNDFDGLYVTWWLFNKDHHVKSFFMELKPDHIVHFQINLRVDIADNWEVHDLYGRVYHDALPKRLNAGAYRSFLLDRRVINTMCFIEADQKITPINEQVTFIF